MTNAVHHSDDEAVDRFAAELKAKLADARAKGRGGWEDKVQVSAKDLSEMLLAHVFKGDPRDVANFAMFLHQRGESIALSEHPAQQQEPVTFLANGTRFKLSFFENEADGCGNASTYVTCFEAFKKELDGRWVTLVSAEDDCHLKGGHSMKRIYLSGPMTGYGFDLVAHLYRQRAFSEHTFGPQTTSGVLDHIRKELREIDAKPNDLSEWVDVILLALDGAWRAGFGPEQIVEAIAAKQERNESRKWPDWRTADPDKAIEHIHGEAA